MPGVAASTPRIAAAHNLFTPCHLQPHERVRAAIRRGTPGVVKRSWELSARLRTSAGADRECRPADPPSMTRPRGAPGAIHDLHPDERREQVEARAAASPMKPPTGPDGKCRA